MRQISSPRLSAGFTVNPGRLRRIRNKPAYKMSTPIRWKERGRVATRDSKSQTPLRALALNLSEKARSALTEPFRLTVEHQRIGLRRLPRELDGFRIVQLSDIHHSPFTSRGQIERAVATANSLQPD